MGAAATAGKHGQQKSDEEAPLLKPAALAGKKSGQTSPKAGEIKAAKLTPGKLVMSAKKASEDEAPPTSVRARFPAVAIRSWKCCNTGVPSGLGNQTMARGNIRACGCGTGTRFTSWWLLLVIAELKSRTIPRCLTALAVTPVTRVAIRCFHVRRLSVLRQRQVTVDF